MNKKVLILVIPFLILMIGLVMSDADWINIKRSSHEYSWAVEYIQPDDSNVSLKTAEILGVTYNGEITVSDIYKLQEWVALNIEYENDEPEYPNQTLLDLNGDCFNKGSLLYSMILHEDEDANSYIVLVDVKLENETTINKHSAVLTIFDKEIIISDTTLGSKTNDLCRLESPEDAIESLLEGTTCDWYLITAIVNMEEYYEFSNNEEFYEWIEER